MRIDMDLETPPREELARPADPKREMDAFMAAMIEMNA
jgi:hypothetical protein